MRIFLGLILLLSFGMFYLAYPLYPGDKAYFILFFVSIHALLAFALRRNASFMDTFLAVFFWLGFWLKFTAGLLEGGDFFETGGETYWFDKAMLISAIGMLGVMTASWFRSRFIFNYPDQIRITNFASFNFYKRYRAWIISGFILLIIAVPLLNYGLTIYQRGVIPETYLPYGLNGVFKWLLLFGLASFSALILRFELELNQKPTLLPVLLALFESFMSSVSMLSRALIINTSALGYGYWRLSRLNNISLKPKFIVVSALLFISLFAASVIGVNYLRAHQFDVLENIVAKEQEQAAVKQQISTVTSNTDKAQQIEETGFSTQQIIEAVWLMTRPLFIDRWIGIEGVLGVLHHGDVGWELWREAWKEKYSDVQTTFYDKMINSPYVGIDITEHHFVNMPGLIAFFYYPGALWFVFVGVFIFCLVGSLFEVFAFKLAGNNIVFSALIGQMVAYRLMSFGYVPAQSYLYFGALALNIVLFFLAEHWLRRFDRDAQGHLN